MLIKFSIQLFQLRLSTSKLSGKVEYERERLLGLADKLMHFQSGSLWRSITAKNQFCNSTFNMGNQHLILPIIFHTVFDNFLPQTFSDFPACNNELGEKNLKFKDDILQSNLRMCGKYCLWGAQTNHINVNYMKYLGH